MTQNKKPKRVLTLTVLLVTGVSVMATPIQWAGNGHYYELVVDQVVWTEAQTAAEAKGGYLATLTSAAENDWVYHNIVAPLFTSPHSNLQAWLGGFTTNPNQSTTDPNAWAWVTGELWDWTNWAPGEPNGDSTGLTINRFANHQWNDEGSWLQNVGGYVVEYERNPHAVPDAGASATLLGLALMGLTAIRSRQRCGS
jgi:hypothetical protein